MGPVWILQKSLWALNIGASAFVVWRLYVTGLHRTYRFFFAGIIVAIVRSAALFPLSPRAKGYYLVWVWTEPLLCLFYILVVFELYALALQHYRGIYSLSRWFFFAAVALSAIVSAITVFPTMGGALASRPLLFYYALAERGIVTSLAIFLLLLLALVAWFPVPLSRNLLTHGSVYTAYFFASNVIFLSWHIGGSKTSPLSSIFKLLAALVCFCCWAFFLSREGETRITALHMGRNSLEEKRLLSQLESLNATLLRTIRK